MGEIKSVSTEKPAWLKLTDALVLTITLTMVAFHLYNASVGVLNQYQQTAIHWGFVGCYIVISRPLKFRGGRVIDAVLFCLNIFISYYQLLLQKIAISSSGIYTNMDIIVSVLAVALALHLAWRILGPILPIVCMCFIAYGLWGRYIPGVFKASKFSFQRLMCDLFANTSSGLYGQTLYVSAQFIFLFTLFGCLLELTGAGQFFVDLAFAVAGKARGGPAQAAVYSSMLMGTINGSGAANVVTTGTFTIPLMQKVGYKGRMAAAVEAVASSGGQIMPPVMGAVAFLMSEMTGIEYSKICIAALIPAGLYYVTLSVSVYLTARKEYIPVADQSQIKNFWKVLRDGWIFFTPLVVLVWLLMSGYSAKRSAFFAIIATMLVGFLKNRIDMTPAKIYNALRNSVAGIAPIAAACISAGVVMDVINLTGLGLKISGIITSIANGNLMVCLVLAMLCSLLLGMGLPTSAAYMVLAVLVAPALTNMGVSMMAAHLFILYFGALSTITPPVALSTFAAAGIAKANIWETGLDAMKLAVTGFVIPFVFCFNSELLMEGTVFSIIFSVITAILGCVVVSSALIGWFGSKLHVISRILLFPCGVMLFVVQPVYVNAIGLGLALAVYFVENKVLHKNDGEPKVLATE